MNYHQHQIIANVSWVINKCSFTSEAGLNFHWEYTFLIGAACLIVASVIASKVKEKIG